MTPEKPKTTHYVRKRRDGINPYDFQMPMDPWRAEDKAGTDIAKVAGDGGKGELSITSLEIAELTGKRHKNVMRDIRVMLADLTGTNLCPFAESITYKDQKGENRPAYRLDKNLTYTLLTGYSTKDRYRVVCRVQELEEQARQGWPDHGRTLAEVVRTVEELKAKVAALESSAAECAAIDCEYAPIFAMRRKYSGYIRWQPLAEASDALGLDTKKVPHNPYGLVNSYHRLAWLEAYGIEI